MSGLVPHADDLAGHQTWLEELSVPGARYVPRAAVGAASNLYALATPVALAVEKWRPTVAPDVPVGLALAIANRESSFSPDAIPRDKTGRIRSTAAGIWQILKGSAAQYGITPEQRTNVDLSTKGALAVFQTYAKMIKRAFPKISSDDLASAVYLGHAKGIASLQKALAAAKAKSLPPTAENLAAITPLPGGVTGFPPQLLIDVRNGWQFWDKARADLGGDWSGLIAWGASRSGPQTVLASSRSRRKPAGGGSSGGGGSGLIIGLAVLGLGLALLKK